MKEIKSSELKSGKFSLILKMQKQSRKYCAIINIAMTMGNVRCTSFLKWQTEY